MLMLVLSSLGVLALLAAIEAALERIHSSEGTAQEKWDTFLLDHQELS